MNEEPTYSENPEDVPQDSTEPVEQVEQSASWIDEEIARPPATPMFPEDIPNRQLRKRSSRSYTNASDRNRAEYRNRLLGWTAGIVAFCIAGAGGFFIGQYEQKKSDIIPFSIFTSSPEAIKNFDESYKAKAKGDTKTALTLLEKIAESEPDTPGLDSQLAEVAFKTRDYDKTRMYAERGLAKNSRPDLCNMILALNAWQQRQGGLTSGDAVAKGLLEKSYEMNPMNPYALYFWGEIERENGSFMKGSELMVKAADRLDPLDSVLVMRTKARLAAIQAQRAAIQQGDISPELVRMDASNGDQKLLQALVYLYQGKSEKAAEAAKVARAVFPSELFTVLIYDVAFREFQLDPAFKELFNKE
ncbi:MAG: hypothetical protein ABI615_03330 [Chthoniobacterales bacterium]